MSHSLQVLYPVEEGTHFDFEYYASEHMKIVGAAIGGQIEKTLITKGEAGANGNLSYHAIASILFKDKSDFDTAMSAIGPAVQDIPNFYNGQPQMVVGQTIA